MRVLIADDHRDAADTLAALIEMEFGCHVIRAYDGQSALQHALAAQPDVLVLDIRMPGIGGVDVARRFQREGAERHAHPAGSPSPLMLAVTGNDVGAVLNEIDGCFHGAFAKPVDGEALLALLRRHWGAGAMRSDRLSGGDLLALTQDEPGPTGDTLARAPHTRPRLLVVDDMEVNRIVAGGLAAALGFEVDSVADGLDAIRHCRHSPPDVVLMDINMPVVGGIDATRHLRHLQRLGRLPRFPILAATANDAPSTADECRLVGMDGFLSKPLALQRLGDELRRVMSGRAAG